MRQTITLACAETGERLYLTSKTNEIHQKITAEKYSPKLRRRALFTEVK